MTLEPGLTARPDHRGGCLCGAVRYHARASPLWSAVCACAGCRRATGAPLVALFAMPDPAFRWDAARPSWFAPAPGISRGFCATCGTPLCHKTTRYPGETRFHTATLDDPDALPPTERFDPDDDAPEWTWRLCTLPLAGSHPSS
ncbi:MAG: GFA family protein [Rhodobacteraceae bacterium]|nr:GFA family protein [Paracoccaceae bacterium]